MIPDQWWLNDLEDDDEAGSRIRIVARTFTEPFTLASGLIGGDYFQVYVSPSDLSDSMVFNGDIANPNTDNVYALYDWLPVVTFGTEMLGDYFEAIIMLADQQESGVFDTDMTGIYYEVTHLETLGPESSIFATNTTGIYFEAIVIDGPYSESGTFGVGFSGDYFDAVEAAPDQTESATFGAGLQSGVYA